MKILIVVAILAALAATAASPWNNGAPTCEPSAESVADLFTPIC